MKGEQVQVQVQVPVHHQHQDLHAGDLDTLGVDPRKMWLDDDQETALDVNDPSIFYNDKFPPLPDFPCMSSSSSSSSTPAPVKTVTCSSSSSSVSSSSSAASWAVLKSDAKPEEGERKQQQQHNSYHHQYSQIDDQTVDAHALSSTASMEISQPLDLSGGIDCMDEMGTFGYMDLFESNEFFDPSSIFQSDSLFMEQFQQDQDSQHLAMAHQLQDHHETATTIQSNPQQQKQVVGQDEENTNKDQSNDNKDPDDMAMVFLEWLRSNRETVSAEDLRSVKIKKSTIECAARRLGGGKEAMKQLLKLVLEWVQTNHLQKRRSNSITTKDSNLVAQQQYQDPYQNPNPNLTLPRVLESNPSCNFTQTSWMAPPPHATAYDPVAGGLLVPIPPPASPPPAAYPSMMGYMTADPFGNGPSSYQPSPEYHHHMIDSGQPSWPSSPFGMVTAPYGSFPDNNIHLAPPQHHPQAFAGYSSQYQPYQYFPGNGERQLMRLGPSATKEARKKRMARQRRLVSPHRHHGHQQNSQQLNNQMPDHNHLQQTRFVGNTTDLNCTGAVPLQPNPGNWFYWPTATAALSPSAVAMMPSITPEAAPLPPVQQMDRPASTQAQNYNQGRSAAQERQERQERRQGWKSEKNLKFLLQKVLKQSDVGSLGRIVLPKKEAETHLPELDARDGISIAMEDIGTSRVWNMRYRYWPNNKSRMYLLENTGDFVRANALQEGDFIVIYSDVKCNKYMIRGVKVRQAGPKSESNKRPGKTQRNQHASTPAVNNGSSPSSATTAHKKITVK
ncbi:LOW QUALITY PROTEIN: B3 domain-containing transcription factor ABI3-like [Pyrus x bretschneideri]|uniref:LOW QUALITY PROTEIN: B3 domain-containing transcription factor ABI3-like n=1 Tax=Pyrus x bretschneideri TaxID=225117 RepID=UPI00202F693F|nr:LOW QUALITY PROTEIN: B3 domain-containing transcription factor ABI3-like [Pyrus x bretschneideri]